MRFAGALAVIVVVVSVASCSGNPDNDSGSGGGGGSPPAMSCNQNPWACPSGQTCGATTASTWACLPSTKGASLGTVCTSLFNQPGCDDGLACVKPVGSSGSMGTCSPFCDETDSAHACPTATTCRTLSFDSKVEDGIAVCITP